MKTFISKVGRIFYGYSLLLMVYIVVFYSVTLMKGEYNSWFELLLFTPVLIYLLAQYKKIFPNSW